MSLPLDLLRLLPAPAAGGLARASRATWARRDEYVRAVLARAISPAPTRALLALLPALSDIVPRTLATDVSDALPMGGWDVATLRENGSFFVPKGLLASHDWIECGQMLAVSPPGPWRFLVVYYRVARTLYFYDLTEPDVGHSLGLDHTITGVRVFFPDVHTAVILTFGVVTLCVRLNIPSFRAAPNITLPGNVCAVASSSQLLAMAVPPSHLYLLRHSSTTEMDDFNTDILPDTSIALLHDHVAVMDRFAEAVWVYALDTEEGMPDIYSLQTGAVCTHALVAHEPSGHFAAAYVRDDGVHGLALFRLGQRTPLHTVLAREIRRPAFADGVLGFIDNGRWRVITV